MKKLIILIIFGMVLISFASAETTFYVTKGESHTIKFSCERDGAMCPASTTCNITINYPNSTVLINNSVATNHYDGYFGYDLNENQTTPSGEYSTRVSCTDGNLNETSTFIYEVNPTGIRPSDQKTESITRAIYFIFGISILLFVVFAFTKNTPPVKWTFFIFSFIFFLIGINLIFISLQDAVINPRLETFFDGFTAISWIMYYFLAALLIIIWIFTTINTYLFKKNLANARRFGEAGKEGRY